MKTTELKTGIKVVLWHGTTQEEHFAANYQEAMAIVDERHSNAYDPSFYDAETGEQLHDFGHGLCTEDGKQVH